MPVKPMFTHSDSSTNSTKFSLFLKTRELQQIAHSLRTLLLKSKSERAIWMEEYGEFLHEAFDAYIDDSNLILNGISFDEESLALSQELVLTLRDAITMVENILDESELHLKG